MTTENTHQNAVLVGLQLPGVSPADMQNSLDELTRLVNTLGYQVVGQVTQKRSTERGAQLLGEGKLKELARFTGGPGVVTHSIQRKKTKAELRRHQEEEGENDGDDSLNESPAESNETPPSILADVVIVDCDLSPSQLRNLETACHAPILDRTGVIIEIFSRHAKTRAARLQVEIARLSYMAPRLRETSERTERQGGGIGGKGAGETSLELDKRRIRDRIKELKIELETISNEHLTRAQRRSDEACVALVGYTNAGKSSLMRALTGSQVLVADQLFATLDTTIRPLFPESRPRILVSDTVGFIKKLPHDLVASFKSTLDEALNASLLMYVVDASDPSFRSQLEVTQSVLSEVGAAKTASYLIFNKRDRLSQGELEQLQLEFPKAHFISTRNQEDLKTLRELMISFFEKEMLEAQLFVPYSAQGVVGEIRTQTRVLSESFDENGITYRVRAPEQKIEAIKKKLIAEKTEIKSGDNL